MDNKSDSNTNSRKSLNKSKSSTSASNRSDYQEELDGINYDYDWNTEYGDGDIPNVDKP